jgi:hypothetical protein
MSVPNLKERLAEKRAAERLAAVDHQITAPARPTVSPLERYQRAGYALMTPRIGKGNIGVGIAISESGTRLLAGGYRMLGEPRAVHLLTGPDALALIPADPADRTSYRSIASTRAIGGNALRDRLLADGWPLGQHAGRVEDGVLIVPRPAPETDQLP